MTEGKKQHVNHLTGSFIRIIHEFLREKFRQQGEPIPPFEDTFIDDVERVANITRDSYDGVDLYPTLESKAAILFYSINKRHIFPNGNKRMSVACLNVFLILNEKMLAVSDEEMTGKAVWLAKTTHTTHSFEEVKLELEKWISRNMVEADPVVIDMEHGRTHES